MYFSSLIDWLFKVRICLSIIFTLIIVIEFLEFLTKEAIATDDKKAGYNGRLHKGDFYLDAMLCDRFDQNKGRVQLAFLPRPLKSLL